MNKDKYPTREEFHEWLEANPQPGLIEDYMEIYDNLFEHPEDYEKENKFEAAIFLSWLLAIKDDIDGTITPNLKKFLYGERDKQEGGADKDEN